MPHAFLYWSVVLLYCLAMIAVGWYIKRWVRAKRGPAADTHMEFWIARRELPGWRLAVSQTSGWLMLGWMGYGMSLIYKYGASALWNLAIPWFILCFIVLLMVPHIRRIGAVSLPQAIQQRFGPSTRLVLAVFSFFVFISWTQAELFMAGKLMHPFLDVPAWVCMLIVVLPIMFYVFLGGFRAVVTTDLIQFAVMVVFMIILAVVAISSARDATDGKIIETLQKTTPMSSGPGETFHLWFLGFLFPILMLVGYLPGWLIEQDLALRIQAACSNREARKGAAYALLLITTFVLVIPTVAAFCAMIVFPPVNGAPPEVIASDATLIVAAFIAKLPVALTAFMLLGLVACQMSVVDTFSNVTTLALSHDLLDPTLTRRGVSPKFRLSLARWLSVAVLALGFALACINDSLQTVYNLSSGVLSACIAVPAFFIFWKRTTKTAALAASIVGFIGTVGMYLYEYKWLQGDDAKLPRYYTDVLPNWLQGSYGYMYVAAGVILSVVTIVLASLLTPKPTPAQLAAVRPAPIENYQEFETSASWEKPGATD